MYIINSLYKQMLSSFVLCKYRSQMKAEELEKFIAEVRNFHTGPPCPVLDGVLAVLRH